MIYFVILLVIVLLIFSLKEFQKENISYQRKKYFFSYHEYEFFKNLEKILLKNFGNKYGIFPKVRLADIFETEKQKGINKIRAKHIDFLIINREKACDPILGIELNGSSHFSQKQQKSDKFKNKIFKNTGLNLLIFYNNQIQNQQYIEQEIIKYLGNINKLGIQEEVKTINSA